MTYELILSDEAKEHMKKWRMSGQKKTLKKIADLFEELKEHPTTGRDTLNNSKAICLGCGVGK